MSPDPAMKQEKPTVFLLDAMSFIFRAYHAMQRQRPMSTRTGLPTAATFVFVNMINKLRRDFHPEYFAAVFDVSAPVFRDERARSMATVRKWNSKTQSFDEVDYAGYKANRSEMPPDLLQQLPYIRRSLEAFRIPILQSEGYEADDVIGTLAAQAAAVGHPVYVVSNDKDMLQLVTDQVQVLNPVKDNLVLDRDKVLETLGVPPEKVIDVMALRGDSVDNIPGAPGIGDKGSVELIQQFGSIEAVLDRASEVKRKSYRESLENNREAILLSKELVTIHCAVPLALDLDDMRTQEPDVAACRALFNELEFTSMLKELAPEELPAQLEILSSPSAQEIGQFLELARAGFSLAIDAALSETAAEQAAETDADSADQGAPAPETTPLLDFAARPEENSAPPAWHMAVSAEAGRTLVFDLRNDLEPGAKGAGLRALLEDEKTPKAVHDLKAILRVFERLEGARGQVAEKGGKKSSGERGIRIAGPVEDLMLYSYLINPTHTTHRLPDVAARFSSRPLDPLGEHYLPESAHAVHALAPVLRAEIESLNTAKLYRDIDLPLVPVLLRMEKAGVRIDRAVLSEMSSRLSGEMYRVSEQIFERAGHRFNINSPKQLGDVLFNKMQLPKPITSRYSSSWYSASTLPPARKRYRQLPTRM